MCRISSLDSWDELGKMGQPEIRLFLFSPEVAVVNAEAKADYVDVGQSRAQCSGDPDALRNLRPIETASNAQGGNGV